ncbi:hypothetical protein [Dongia sedimenti]|uniref:Uncharacterized protein n=1 Tax=Dongia sedimenti TaxID=3064282 RepID=A0ABU0YIW5_9PROT|nr:hypothetical protein [Rhodospirillaceae bacterium R-7]
MVDPMPRFNTVSAAAGSVMPTMVKLAAAANATDNAVLLENAMKPLPDFRFVRSEQSRAFHQALFFAAA